jgi:hypothetical protein
MANQILLAAGAEEYGPPATMGKGVKAAKKYLKQLKKLVH